MRQEVERGCVGRESGRGSGTRKERMGRHEGHRVGIVRDGMQTARERKREVIWEITKKIRAKE